MTSEMDAIYNSVTTASSSFLISNTSSSFLISPNADGDDDDDELMKALTKFSPNGLPPKFWDDLASFDIPQEEMDLLSADSSIPASFAVIFYFAFSQEK